MENLKNAAPEQGRGVSFSPEIRCPHHGAEHLRDWPGNPHIPTVICSAPDRRFLDQDGHCDEICGWTPEEAAPEPLPHWITIDKDASPALRAAVGAAFALEGGEDSCSR